MHIGIAREGRNADAPRQEQGRSLRLHRETGAEGTPYSYLVARAQMGHAFGAASHHLEKKHQALGRDPADGQRPGPGHILPPGLRTHHDKLAGMPFAPVGAFQGKGVKTALAGFPEGNIVRHRKLGTAWGHHGHLHDLS